LDPRKIRIQREGARWRKGKEGLLSNGQKRVTKKVAKRPRLQDPRSRSGSFEIEPEKKSSLNMNRTKPRRRRHHGEKNESVKRRGGGGADGNR